MSASDKALQAYIDRILQMQNTYRDRPFSKAELKQIALDAGMSEEEWQASQNRFQEVLNGGKNLLQMGNYTDALPMLKEAVAINPYEVEPNYWLAKAFAARWKAQKSSQDQAESESYAGMALQANATHKPTLALLSELRETDRDISQGKQKQRFLLTGIVVLVGVIIIGIYTWTYNGLVNQEEKVNQAWAQVENVYQRRADLIPKLIEIAQSSANADQSLLKQLTELQKELNQFKSSGKALSAKDLEAFQAKQDELSKAFQSALIKTGNNQTLQGNTNYSGLKIQVEGSENRIAVERRKFNETVQQFNTSVGKFPGNLLGFKPKAYFKAQQGTIK